MMELASGRDLHTYLQIAVRDTPCNPIGSIEFGRLHTKHVNQDTALVNQPDQPVRDNYIAPDDYYWMDHIILVKICGGQQRPRQRVGEWNCLIGM